MTAATLIAVAAPARFAIANPPTTAPAPLLDQISQETQNLFQSVRSGMVVVQLPPPRLVDPFTDANSPMQKWITRLDPKMVAQLHMAQMRAGSSGITSVSAVVAASQPAATEPSGQLSGQPSGADEAVHQSSGPQLPARTAPTLFIRRPDGEVEFITADAPNYDAIAAQISPRFLGLVLDDAGHVLIPIFVDKDALRGQPLHVLDSEGKPVVAKFVGSDRQTNLTVVQVDPPIGKPLKIAGDRPADGSLVMLLSPDGNSGHLSIWTNGEQDRGLLVATSGAVGGFVRTGQFLSGNAIKPVADQLIQFGKVRRAALGVLISQAETPDGHPAMFIEQVIEHSAAADAGLHDGDFILSLAGSPVGDVPSFAAAIAQSDGPTELQLLRDGRPVIITVNLKPQ